MSHSTSTQPTRPHPALSYPIITLPPLIQSPETEANKLANLELISELKERSSIQCNQGSAKAQNLHLSRGMLLARDRIALLLDQDSPFMELCTFAGFDQDDSTPCGSAIAGIGIVEGILCMVSANIPTLQGGAANEMGVAKGERLGQIAWENRLPVISIVQTAGANLTQQFRVFHKGGSSFRNLARRSLAGIPTCSVVMGSSTAGGAYTPGMSDYTIAVKLQAQIFLGGPPLVKMATNEISTAEELGGADMHSKISGVVDELAEDEFQALTSAREWIHSLNWSQTYSNTKLKEQLTSSFFSNPLQREIEFKPIVRMESLLQVAKADIRKPWDIMELIARVVDGSRFMPFKTLYGTNLICGWGFIAGHPVGIVGNNSVLFPQEANKATQFIRLCNTRKVPIVFLHNISGFIVGKKYEEAGIIKAGSLMINAVSNSTVPHLSIICGSSYGAGNYAMVGRAYEPRFLFSWPQSRCSVMGSDALAGVLDLVARDAAKRSGKVINEEKQQGMTEMFKMGVESQSDSYYTSSRMLDDGIIDPRDTRNILAFCLEIINQDAIEGNQGFGGVSRM